MTIELTPQEIRNLMFALWVTQQVDRKAFTPEQLKTLNDKLSAAI